MTGLSPRVLAQMMPMVVESHRQYFRKVLDHLADDPDNESILVLMLTVIIGVINRLKPTMPANRFANELGFFLLDFLVENGTLDRVVMKPLSRKEQAHLILSDKVTKLYFTASVDAFCKHYATLIF